MRTRLSHSLMALPLLALILVPAPGFALEAHAGFDCGPSCVELYAGKLSSARQGEWREAQQHLAWAGVDGLAAVDSVLARGKVDSLRVRGFLSLSLRVTTTPEDLDQFPRLSQLARGPFRKGIALALAQAMDTVIVERPSGGSELIALGGFAVPGARLLCAQPRPGARARGVALLGEITALSQMALLDSLTSDMGRYGVWHDDYGTASSVADIAIETASRLRSDFTGRYRYEVLLPSGGDGSFTFDEYALINGLREYTSVVKESTWACWWSAARPAWNVWWDLSGDAPTEASVRAWFNRLTETEGWRVEFTLPDPEVITGPTIVHFLGPRTTKGEVWLGDRLLRKGGLPIRLDHEIDRAIAKEPRLRETGLRLVAYRPDHVRWEKLFVLYQHSPLTVTLLDKPRPLE